MSAAPKMCDNPCQTCKKEGLPLLLTRYALIPKDSGGPTLSGQLKDPALDAAPLGSNEHYGLRLLRSGYVYVFDEKHKLWDEYFVTHDGILSKLPRRPLAKVPYRQPPTQPRPAPQVDPAHADGAVTPTYGELMKVAQPIATEFRCARNGAAPLAGVITVPASANKVWLAFSNVEWTIDVMRAHLDETHRKRHMRCITVRGGKVAPQPGTAPLNELAQHIPEFKLPSASAHANFQAWCPHRFNGRQAKADHLLRAVESAHPQGGAAIVALHDPVGLLEEIASLMEVRKRYFMSEDSRAMQLFAANGIATIEASVKEQARNEALDEAVKTQAAAMGEFGHMVDQSVATAHLTATQLKDAADAAWQKYILDRQKRLRFNEQDRKAWLAKHNKDMLEHDKVHIASLAKAHATWMQHPCLVGHMSCNYDRNDKLAGEAFTTTMVDLIVHTTDKQPSYDLYLKWLKDGDYADTNLLMRALGFNQTELIDQLKKPQGMPVDGRAFPTDAAMLAVATFIDKMPDSAKARLTALLAGLSGPALSYWNGFHAGKVGSKAAAAMAAVSGKQFVRIPITGSKGQFIQAYMRELYRLDPELKAKPNQLQSAIAKQIRLMEIEGVKMNGHSKLGWYVLLDKKALAGVTSKNLSGQALADEVARAIRSPQDIQKLDMSNVARFNGRIYAGTTLLGGLLMLVNFNKLFADVANGMSHQQDEAKAKLALGSVALGGFVAEQMGDGLSKLGETRLRNTMGRAGSIIPEALRVGGRLLGFGAGVALGLWDISKGVAEDKNGNAGLSNAYFFSGGAGIMVAMTSLALSMGWTAFLGPFAWLAWVVLAVGLVVWIAATFAVESLQDNPRQKWLYYCHFGSAPASEKYQDAKTHAEQYKLALAG